MGEGRTKLRSWIRDEIAGNDVIFGVPENTLEVAFGSGFHGSLDLVVRSVLGETDREVNHRDVGSGSAERQSRPRTPQRDMPCWLHEINGTPQRQNRPFQRDPQHQQTAHPAVPSRSRSEHGDSDDPYHVFLCVKRAVQRACVVRCHALRTRCVGNSKPIILPAHATGTRVR